MFQTKFTEKIQTHRNVSDKIYRENPNT